MSGKITPELIREHGIQLRRIALDEKRAAEVAEEVARLNETVIDAADRLLDFNDEPGRFAALLAGGAQPWKSRK
jgi:hypothetical protein